MFSGLLEPLPSGNPAPPTLAVSSLASWGWSGGGRQKVPLLLTGLVIQQKMHLIQNPSAPEVGNFLGATHSSWVRNGSALYF